MPTTLPDLETMRLHLLAHWRSYAKACAALVLVGYGLHRHFDTGLSYERVGPRMAAGRTTLVLLHGYGASGDDLVGLAREISDEAPGVTILVPAAPYRAGAGFGRTWIEPFSVPTQAEVAPRMAIELERTSVAVWTFLGDVRRRGVRCEDIVLGGFSQGGGVAAYVALRSPPGCALGGLIVMSGSPVDLVASEASVASRVLITHGAQDPVIEPDAGRSYARYFAARGNPVRWLSFVGGHALPTVVRAAVSAFVRGGSPGEEWVNAEAAPAP